LQTSIIKWSDEYSLGNEELDNQHKELFEIASKIHNIRPNPKAKEQIKKILYDFSKYMLYHFKAEEEYMEKIGYPKLEEHRKIHQKFVGDVRDALKEAKGITAIKETIETLTQEWLVEHITKVDVDIHTWQRKQKKRKSTPKDDEIVTLDV
jgi:hemerythrin